MAVVRFGPIVQSASGALGGLVFSRQGGTSIVRTRPLLRNPRTARQLTTRAAYNRVVALWRSLTDAQRLNWFRVAQTYRQPKPDGTSNPLTAWQTFATVQLRYLDMPYGAATLYPDPYPLAGTLETSGIRLDVWPGGPINMVHSRGGPSLLPLEYNRICYDLFAQRPFRTFPTLPGRLRLSAWHDWSRTYSNNLLSTSNYWRPLIGTRWLTNFELPAASEFITWHCTSHFLLWPSSTLWSGTSQVPNVSSELLTNGDFELPDDAGAGARTGWTPSAGATATTEIHDVWGDAYSLRWQVPAAAGEQNLSSGLNIDVTTPGAYTLRFAAMTTIAAAWYGIYLLLAPSGTVTITTASPPADGLWHEYSYPFNVPADKTLARLRFQKNAGTATDIYLDNITIRRDL